jgi:hypothetical protein
MSIDKNNNQKGTPNQQPKQEPGKTPERPMQGDRSNLNKNDHSKQEQGGRDKSKDKR